MATLARGTGRAHDARCGGGREGKGRAVHHPDAIHPAAGLRGSVFGGAALGEQDKDKGRN